MRQEEEEILEKVREVLGVRHVIRVCSNADQHKVIAAAKRLLRNAHKIVAAGIDLRGAPYLEPRSPNTCTCLRHCAENCWHAWSASKPCCDWKVTMMRLETHDHGPPLHGCLQTGLWAILRLSLLTKTSTERGMGRL